MAADDDKAGDLVARAELVTNLAELAELLRDLRRREARERQGRVLSHRTLAAQTGWSAASVGAYLAGVTVPPTERFDELLRALGARPHEHGPFATARDRVEDAHRPHRMLADAAIAPEEGRPTAPSRTLPALARQFTGRAAALARLDTVLSGSAARGAAVVATVAGMGGVGKTTLAVHWGHLVADRFPDGQVYVNLRGYDPDAPLSTSDALAVLIAGLGESQTPLPADEAERHSLYRSLLSGQRTLVVLDNARSSAQVQPLLPPSPCVTVVTSRDDLADLSADGEVCRVWLDVFAEDEAVTLLRQLIGERADREPEALRALAARCGYLPLALRVVAELAAFRSAETLATLVHELDADLDTAGLEAFDTGDVRSDLRAVIAWSVRCLPNDAARALLLLGLVPGGDVDEYGLAALAGVAPSRAADLLALLGRAHLVEPWPPGRYAMHDLVRAYARGAALQELDLVDRQNAMNRLLDYYLTATVACRGTLIPGSNPGLGRGRAVPTGEVSIPELSSVDTAAAWLEAERANVVAACLHAARHGWPAHAVATAVELWAFLDEAHAHDAVAVHRAALAAADLPGADADPRDRARLLAALALAHFRLGRLDSAAAHAQESIAVSRDAGDESGSTLALTVLGSVRTAQGRFAEVLAIFEAAVEVGRAQGPGPHLQALLNLCRLKLELELFDAAEAGYRQAATIAGELGLEIAQADQGIAMALIHLGRCGEAVPIAERAVMRTREEQRPARLVPMLDTLAQAYRGIGQTAQAIDLLAEAVELCRHAGSYPAAHVLNTLGETYLVVGDLAQALSSHEEAFELAEHVRDRTEQARALVGLGDAHAAGGDHDRATSMWTVALDEYSDMGLPAAARVEARLRGAP